MAGQLRLNPADTQVLTADVTEHIRMNVQSDIGHIVKMLAGDQPDYLTDQAFRIISGLQFSFDFKAESTRRHFFSLIHDFLPYDEWEGQNRT